MQGEPTTAEESALHRSDDKDVAAGPSSRSTRMAVLLLGLVLPQILLYGPSLTGRKILLPLDVLATEGHYLPARAGAPPPMPKNYGLADEVLLATPAFEYAAKQMRAGHVPLWSSQNFSGAPFATFPKYSLSFLIFCCWPHPITLAYMQLIKSVIAGLGAYLFFRRALRTGFWASAIGAWCYPLTGFFVQWRGYGLTDVVAWLPWLLMAVNLTIRRPKGFGPVLLAIFTALALLAGQLDVAGLVLLSSGLYALVCLIEIHGLREWNGRIIASAATLTLGWALGLCIATAYVAPLIEYSRTGERFARRAAGEAERPPVGITALPQIILPNLYGSTERGSLRFVDGAQPESSAAGYAGLLATLLLAPLAFCHRELKNRAFWCLGLLVLSLGWLLDIPGLVQLMRMPLANMFSWNRWMMLTGFALTVFAVIGLDALIKGMVKPRLWFVIPSLLAAGVSGWCLYRIDNMPQPLENFSQMYQISPYAMVMLKDLTVGQATALVQGYFRFWYGVGAVFAALTFIGWVALVLVVRYRNWMVAIAGSLMIAELLIYANDVSPQLDPALYYPPVAAMEELKQHPPGRILCVQCLPPDLNLMLGLSDIRGYDAVDPKRLMDVIEFARAPGTPTLPYARTQWFIPWDTWAEDGSVHVSPILSMLNVRYLIWARDLPSLTKTIIRRDGYNIVENQSALPRAFIPQAIQSLKDGEEMDRLRDGTFDAARISYVTEPVDLPAESRGAARVADESPESVTVDVQMETAGMVVLADLWDKGWHASIDGQDARILAVNHAIRGVVVAAGQHRIIFRYLPDSVRIGAIVSCVALLITLGWLTGLGVWRRRECASLSDAPQIRASDSHPQV